jgi:hypothetical protein
MDYSEAHLFYFSNEEILFDRQASAFTYADNQWKQLDGGSSQIWLLRNPSNQSYRIVARRNDTQTVHKSIYLTPNHSLTSRSTF